jgi:hypothetical protein
VSLHIDTEEEYERLIEISPRASAVVPTNIGCGGSRGLTLNIDSMLEPGFTAKMSFDF